MRKMYAILIYYCGNFLDAQSMSSVTYLRLNALIYIVHLCSLIVRKQLKKMKEAYKNSDDLRAFYVESLVAYTRNILQ